MRRNKIEEIRRLISAATSMCDQSILSEARRHLLLANKMLDSVDEKTRKKKAAGEAVRATRLANPKAAIGTIESMIEMELDKLSRPETQETING
jgi:hypothetical protein